MVNVLQFNLSTPTSYVFMKRFLKAAQSDKRVSRLIFISNLTWGSEKFHGLADYKSNNVIELLLYLATFYIN